MSDTRSRFPIPYVAEYGIYAGVRDAEQWLLTFRATEMLRVRFTLEGVLIGYDVEQYGSTLREEVQQRILSELDCSAPIQVEEFYLQTEQVGICLLPKVFRDFLAYPDEFPGELGEQTQADLISWQQSGQFVLNWAGGEYWINQEAEVVSS